MKTTIGEMGYTPLMMNLGRIGITLLSEPSTFLPTSLFLSGTCQFHSKWLAVFLLSFCLPYQNMLRRIILLNEKKPVIWRYKIVCQAEGKPCAMALRLEWFCCVWTKKRSVWGNTVKMGGEWYKMRMEREQGQNHMYVLWIQGVCVRSLDSSTMHIDWSVSALDSIYFTLSNTSAKND
jgi:hypothetical protein